MLLLPLLSSPISFIEIHKLRLREIPLPNHRSTHKFYLILLDSDWLLFIKQNIVYIIDNKQ